MRLARLRWRGTQRTEGEGAVAYQVRWDISLCTQRGHERPDPVRVVGLNCDNYRTGCGGVEQFGRHRHIACRPSGEFPVRGSARGIYQGIDPGRQAAS